MLSNALRDERENSWTQCSDVCFPLLCGIADDTQLADPLKCLIIYSYTSVIDVCLHRCPDRSLSEHHAHYVHREDLQAGEIVNQSFLECAHCEGEEWRWEKERHVERRGQQQPKVGKEERYFDWQLSGLVPAEVVPPVDCYYQQKDFPIALAGTVSPLSPGGCYPIWEEMNRGPLAPYEVSVDRIFTEGAQWSKQALCQYQHLRHHSNYWPSNGCVSNWSIWGICLRCGCGRRARLNYCPPLAV